MVNRKLELVTTKQLMALAGIGSRDTVRAYERAGLISTETPANRPKRKGAAKFWSRECVESCVRVKAMRGEGLDYEEIKKVLLAKEADRVGQELGSVSDRQSSIADAAPRAIAAFEAAIRDAKRLARFTRGTKTQSLPVANLWKKAMKCAKGGDGPILIITESNVDVIPQSELGVRFAKANSGKPTTAVLVVPLAEHFKPEIERAKGESTRSYEDRIIEI